MSFPPKLKKGDTIGIFTPSHPITAIAPQATQRAISFLESQGYKVKKGRLTGKRDFYRSGTIAERAQELNELIADNDVKCMMATVGGMISNALLPYIDYPSLRRNPKIIIGHSDITALLLGIYAMTGIITYYGPNLVTTFGQLPPFLDFSMACFESVLGENAELPYTYPTPAFYSDEPTEWESGITEKVPKPNCLITVNAGFATGRLMGGNLNTINSIMASPYMPDFHEGDILFLEDTEKFAAYAERYFSMLKICGVLDKVSGIILGKHRKFDDQQSGRTPADILLEVLGNRDIPILADFDCSHTVPMLTLPLGSTIQLDATHQTVTLIGSAPNY